ncbi:transcription factor HES-1-B [Galendromus occidentalis]|uniref:Transcription factor HES-1-B n=1 Tax=Galendromus occidentalis TaxID=34638 RepID=A0AAJ6QP99_9ACAR|nr:transcription factor HES-1-B [Galendromus occidentalis]
MHSPASPSQPRKASEQRRTTKPIMEKRRRARINNSLNELKNLILDYNKSKDTARHNKLEKADILEMAVRHVQMLHRQTSVQRAAVDPNVSDKFRAGYMECAKEVSRYLSRSESVDGSVRQCLLSHLSQTSPVAGRTSPMETATPTAMTAVTVAAQKYFGNPQVQLVPTRLPSGEIALVVPKNGSDISVNCNTLNVLGSSGILSPAASERSVTSPMPLLTSVLVQTPPPPPMDLVAGGDGPVWRPW